jgi:hypothetical protein
MTKRIKIRFNNVDRTMVDHLTHNCRIYSSNYVYSAGREKIANNNISFYNCSSTMLEARLTIPVSGVQIM